MKYRKQNTDTHILLYICCVEKVNINLFPCIRWTDGRRVLVHRLTDFKLQIP